MSAATRSIALLGLVALGCREEAALPAELYVPIEEYRALSSEVRVGGPLSIRREPAETESFVFEGQAVQVTREHLVEESGELELRYEYDVFEFVLGPAKLFGRSYTDKALEAHLMAAGADGTRRPLVPADLSGALGRAAVHYLRSRGKTQLRWLDPSNEVSGYSPIP